MSTQFLFCLVFLMTSTSGLAEDFEKGTPSIKSAGPIAFSPEGILFVGDFLSATVFAIDPGDQHRDPFSTKLDLKDIDKKVIEAVGDDPRFFGFDDMAIQPTSGKLYLSFNRGVVGKKVPGLVRIGSSGKVEVVSLQELSYAKATLPNPAPHLAVRPGPSPRESSITHLAFYDGRLLVSGLSDAEPISSIVSIPYPFEKTVHKGTRVEIYYCGRGEINTILPIRTFTTCELKGVPYLLATYTQSPLVKIPISTLKPDISIRGITVADLGNRNNPLDMITYRKDGRDFVLVSNTRQGVMKISLDWLAEAPSIETPYVGPSRMPHEKIAELRGITLMERIDDNHAVVLGQKAFGGVDLFSIPLP